jgi:hypothetical protein
MLVFEPVLGFWEYFVQVFPLPLPLPYESNFLISVHALELPSKSWAECCPNRYADSIQ